MTEDWITIDALVVRCIVGVLDRERHTPQEMHIKCTIFHKKKS